MIKKSDLIRCVRKIGSLDYINRPDWQTVGGIIWITRETARKMKERGLIY